tara:strand:- start:282 stop:716 length:435 start_codon:yes stop_codon:yes gene_type:complete
MPKMKKGSAAAKAWGRKMKALRNKPKSKKSSTKKGGRRKTARRAYTGLKRKANKVKRRSSSVKGLKSITGSSTLKKVALGVGGAAIATAVISMIMPNSAIGRYAGPIGGYAMGGIEGVLGAMVLPMVTGRVGGNSNVAPALESL